MDITEYVLLRNWRWHRSYEINCQLYYFLIEHSNCLDILCIITFFFCNITITYFYPMEIYDIYWPLNYTSAFLPNIDGFTAKSNNCTFVMKLVVLHSFPHKFNIFQTWFNIYTHNAVYSTIRSPKESQNYRAFEFLKWVFFQGSSLGSPAFNTH